MPETAELQPQHPSLATILASDHPEVQLQPDWQSWAITDTGKRRLHNEDAFLNKPETGIWVVADGMGGHAAGDIASRLIVDTLQHLSMADNITDTANSVENSLQQTNKALRQLANEKYGNHVVGSTVIALVCQGKQCAFLWAGDSRLYRLRNHQLQQLTQDHSDTEQQTNNWAFKNNNVITRAIGAHDDLLVDIECLDLQAGDIFLLCSDGLDKEMSFNEIEHIMKTTQPEKIAEVLVAEVLSRGARDNVTVVVVAVSHCM